MKEHTCSHTPGTLYCKDQRAAGGVVNLTDLPVVRLTTPQEELHEKTGHSDQLTPLKKTEVVGRNMTAQGELQETETTKTTTADILAEMRALRDMVVELNLQVELLQKENTERKVAFYTGLTDGGQVGKFNTDFPLKYSKVFTNIGGAYNPSTGFFTAPVRGVYYFQFTMNGYQPGNMGVYVYKNNERIMYNVEIKEEKGNEYMTNSVVLELMAGDEIYLVLPRLCSLWDSSYNHNTFSGSLLFTL
ncbi:complement C1q-like protein 3 [Centropristis striata]|uniref:complement C1q-like protein 3 n=1 Tax=Centropristis striata TaxID=184440 RepID=UPI0027E1B831|nr:complement C1q-like protein 3 [Centropristis striata]